MTLQEFKSALENITEINFILPNGYFVPKYFHITEVGVTTKDFIDCGGTLRSDKKANFQLWLDETDKTHRITPNKLLSIIGKAEQHFDLAELEIEAEYQVETINKYNIELENDSFALIPQQTDCLAPDLCGISSEKPKIRIVNGEAPSCDPNSGCC